MKEERHLFTLAEANSLIPRLNEMIKHIQDKKNLYDRRHDEVFMHELLNNVEQVNGYGELSAAELENDCLSLEQDLMDLKREIAKIQSLGCIVSDLESGQVDLPAQKDGKIICYSWQTGEEVIKFYKQSSSKGAKRIPLSA